jgi:hypothetical protein
VTLSDRLERAKRERLLAAGLLHSEAALKPDPDIDVTDDARTDAPADDGIHIEVASAGLHPVAQPTEQVSAPNNEIVTDEQSPNCPNCLRPGRVDMVDLVGNTVHLSCGSCGTMWRARRTISHPND